jgi:hypothetical protein
LEQVRIGLITTQAEAGCDVERHLVAAVGDTATNGPAVVFEHPQGAEILDEPVAQGAIKLEPIAVGTHPPIAD